MSNKVYDLNAIIIRRSIRNIVSLDVQRIIEHLYDTRHKLSNCCIVTI